MATFIIYKGTISDYKKYPHKQTEKKVWLKFLQNRKFCVCVCGGGGEGKLLSIAVQNKIKSSLFKGQYDSTGTGTQHLTGNERPILHSPDTGNRDKNQPFQLIFTR